MIARRDPAHALGEQHPLEPARQAPPVVRRTPARAHRIDAEPIELLPSASRRPRRPRWPWQPFAAAPVLAWLIVHGGLPGMVLGGAGIVGVFAWIDRWVDKQWEQTKRENGW